MHNVNLLFSRACVWLALFSFTQLALADVPYTPPSTYEQGYAGTPVEKKLRDMGYNTQTGTLKYDGKNGTSTSKTKTTFNDNYGNKTTGTVTAQNNMPKTGPFAKGAAAYASAKAAGAAVNSDAAREAAAAAARGDSETAWQKAAEAALEGLASLDPFGLGGGIWGIYDAYDNAKNPYEETRDAAKKKAREFDYPVPTAPFGKQDFPEGHTGVCVWGICEPKGYKFEGGTNPTWEDGKIVSYQASFRNIKTGEIVILGTYANVKGESFTYFTVTGANQKAMIDKANADKDVFPKVAPEDIILTAADYADILERGFENIMKNQQANHFDLMRAMYGMGLFGQGGMFEGQDGGSAGIKILGSTQDNTFRTAPFTPAGSNQAQQTQFQVNQDGSVTVSTVNRPDLASNTEQAPTRSEVGRVTTAPTTRPAQDGSTAAKPDVCAQNPNSLMCVDVGDTSYTDPTIPDLPFDLSFTPATFFKTDGTCPPPLVLDAFHGKHEISYQFMCDSAAKIRPIIIAASILMASLMVFSTVKEL